MKMDNEFEASFVRIVGLIGFIIACVGFLLTISGMADFNGQESESVLFMSFIMCVALAFVGLMISTLAQVLRSVRGMEALIEKQNKILDEKLAAPKPAAATPKKTATSKASTAKKTTKTATKPAAKTTAKKSTTAAKKKPAAKKATTAKKTSTTKKKTTKK